MKSLISLRQHKIIRLLRDSKAPMTSAELSEKLSVSSKTIRNDITDINRAFAKDGIRIDSIMGKGYLLKAQDPALLRKFSTNHRIFLSRSDRVFYLSLLLCTAEQPIELPDLEEEISVSSSTLSGDLAAFKKRFVHGSPFISFITEKNAVMIEKNEFKRRFILTKLLCSHWDFNSTGNVYYESELLDSEAFAIINKNVATILFRHGILLEDYYLIWLNLYLTLAWRRIREGFLINPYDHNTPPSESTKNACRELFEVLEQKLDFEYPEIEKAIVRGFIEDKHIPCGRDILTGQKSFASSEEMMPVVDAYLEKIREVFGLDFRKDEEFKDLLLHYADRFNNPLKDLTVRDEPGSIKQVMPAEFEIAALFSEVAEEYHLSVWEEDLLYLTPAVSGALYKKHLMDESLRFRTVLLCHLGCGSMWNLMVKLKSFFSGVLDLTDVIPVNLKDYYDFSDVDLILTTVSKKIVNDKSKPVLVISPYITTDDRRSIDLQITDLFINKLYPKNIRTLSELLENAQAHEKMLFSSRLDLIRFLAKDFTETGIYTEDHVTDLIKRESITSYAWTPAITILYTTRPAKETALSICTLDHRILWNSHKIRIIFLLSLKKEDMTELFYILRAVYRLYYQPDVLKRMKTKEELVDYYRMCETGEE